MHQNPEKMTFIINYFGYILVAISLLLMCYVWFFDTSHVFAYSDVALVLLALSVAYSLYQKDRRKTL
jgi:hypothetical protein